MTMEVIQEALKAEPFIPFRLWTSSGQHYDVLNPELVVPLRNRLFVALADLEHTAFLSYLHITSLESIANGPRTKRGKRRPRG